MGSRAFDAPPARAQDAACVADAEPNDRPESAMPIEDHFCIDGTIGEADQDVFLWTVKPERQRRGRRVLQA